jgi:hypothetical protein
MKMPRQREVDDLVRYTAVTAYNLTDWTIADPPTALSEDNHPTMDSTQARRRPGVAKGRSRSLLPRINTREPVQQKREPSSFKAVLLGIFQVLLALVLASVAILSFAILADKTWLPRFCDQAVITDTSAALSRIIHVDICKTTLAGPGHGVQPSRISPALAIIQQAESMREDIIELINSQYKSKIHAAVEVRLSESPLQWAESKDKAIDRPKQDLHKEMEQFFRKYSEFALEDLHSANVFAAYEFREISAMVGTVIRDAHARGNVSRSCAFFESWLPDVPLVGRLFSRPSSQASLLARLRTTDSALIPRLGFVYQKIDGLLDDLKRLNLWLGKVKGEPQNDVALIEAIEQPSVDFALINLLTKEIRRQIARLGDSVLVLRRLVERHRCIAFSPEDGDLMGDLEELWQRLSDISDLWEY